jgi:hypothetical protein
VDIGAEGKWKLNRECIVFRLKESNSELADFLDFCPGSTDVVQESVHESGKIHALGDDMNENDLIQYMAGHRKCDI